METHDTIVIGGGISGMTFAHYVARQGRSTVVLEKDASPGGCIRSHRPIDGFWLELGAHTCYNSYGALLEVIEAAAGLDRLLPRQKAPFKLLSGGKLRAVTKELRWLELLRSAPRLAFSKKDGQTVAQYYGRIVGRRNYERVFSRLFAAVPSQNADEFPADMLFKRRERRKDVPRSFTLEGGLETIVDAIAAQDGVDVEAGCEVATVERGSDGYLVQTNDHRSFSARSLALAVPPPAAAALVGDLLPPLAETLRQIRAVSIESTGIIVRSERLTLERVAGIIPMEDGFFSAVSRDVVPHNDFRGFSFHFAAGLDEGERLSRVGATLGLAPQDFEHVTTRSVVLPSPRLGHAALTAAVDDAIAGTPLFVTGNYFAGLSIEDCVQRSRSEADRLSATA